MSLALSARDWKQRNKNAARMPGTDVVPGIFLDYSSVFRQNKLFESHDLLLRIFVNTASSKRFIPLFLMT